MSTYKDLIKDIKSDLNPLNTGLNSDLTKEIPEKWLLKFHFPDSMADGEIEFLIKDFLPEGVCCIGGLPGHGKSWFSLNMAKALCTGTKFLGFEVPNPQNVLYLNPESGERSLKYRINLLDIPQHGRFLVRTMKDGFMGLGDADLISAVKSLKPVVFLDTLIRFGRGEENSSSDSNQLAKLIFNLVKAGAKAVVCVHHSAKAAANSEFMTLENVLRGSGDLGAMADVVYGLKCTNQDSLEIKVACVKARDFDPVKSFIIQGRPGINENHGFRVLTEPGQTIEQSNIKRVAEAIKNNPSISYRELAALTGVSKSCINQYANKSGFEKQGDLWVQKPDKSETINKLFG